ncbi:hypothetical protein RND81_06G070000 [Saponaria officinalis]|uniref:PB1 domain-containing protein n=1 Tax=Saponaria officinalis TaxID=3572 RepID=A0AAW1K8W3_SAPOF
MNHSPPLADLPLPTHHIADVTTTITAANHVLPRSTESSPKSTHHADWDEPLAPLPGAKLRLMCSYGGHIIPRPYDKSLCYVGGETRMVAVERNSTLQDLIFRLSKTLLDGRQFTMKYQLPNEELDSLISVGTDEDLENMVEEYDRIMAVASPLKPSSGRLRLFLFFVKPETSKTMGALLDDAKSETWFVDALNGANMLPRGLSDSAAMDDLLSLGSGVNDQAATQTVGEGSNASAHAKISSPQMPQDVHSIQSVMPDSPMIETTTSSFDSATSSPSMAHLPPIRVRAEESGSILRLQDDLKAGASLEEQLSSQLKLTSPLPTAVSTQSAVAATYAGGGGNEINYSNRAISDEERSDHGVHVPSRKPPLPLHPLQNVHQRFGGGFNLPSPDSKNAGGIRLPSPDSVKSDNNIASATSFSKVVPQQEPEQGNLNEINHRAATTEQNLFDNRAPSPSTQTQVQPMQDPRSYIYPPQQQDPHQYQYIQQNMQYIPTHAPQQSYYQAFATTQQSMQPQIDHQHSHYPLYILSVNQNQPYNMPIQPTESTVTSSAPQSQQPVYQTRAAPPTNNPPGMAHVGPISNQQYHQYVTL